MLTESLVCKKLNANLKIVHFVLYGKPLNSLYAEAIIIRDTGKTITPTQSARYRRVASISMLV